jgi:hypothetical protein
MPKTLVCCVWPAFGAASVTSANDILRAGNIGPHRCLVAIAQVAVDVEDGIGQDARQSIGSRNFAPRIEQFIALEG